ncbi:MAG: M14 family zinc carboxypeptidase [Proteobacteria bacterium]|nr:M14 family zinc carboxypeptidase [Pseudomonadota bacterium]
MRLNSLNSPKLLTGIFSSGIIIFGIALYGNQSHAAAYDTTGFFIEFPVVTVQKFHSFEIPLKSATTEVNSFCERVKQSYVPYNWDFHREGCDSTLPWKAHLKSHAGSPLIYAEFGTGENTTLILGGVHPDEITPIPLAFRFANHLQSKPQLVAKDAKVVIAPLVNPDGFFRLKASRTNLNGVDLNRNFFTTDWYTQAQMWWTQKRQNNPRHFPGHIPNSEIETLFQIWLIDTFRPDKIISIHSPLGFYDYDGPGERKKGDLTESEKKAKKLVVAMSDSSKNYKVVDYSFYPGSLGNYAGNERGIPTITLELETTDHRKSDQYWKQFSPGLEQAIQFPFKNSEASELKGTYLFLKKYNKASTTEKTRYGM